ncbi:TrkH family potassium uptake protein [Thiofilum flexile]|uniref:TrkH family potassium uptake protein n=1 Tax=Thiofilum flexile TaxID=125627 RepID=UPI0003652771|nr:TrkH family potassium uptake protein [Thiofilum flexile]
MSFLMIQRIIGILLMIFSFCMLPPIAIGWLMDDVELSPFWSGFIIVFLTGLCLWLPVYRVRQDLRLRDGFLIAVLFWTILSAAATIPLLLSNALDLNLASAVFETVSGFTTSGGTVIMGLDGLPKSILFYRVELHWLGGMGVLVLAVAILPMLGIGGMQLYKAEAPGPVKDEKLTPRITETAKLLWYIYLIMTVIATICYKLAGMDWFDAVCHAFSAIATGGFTNHDSGMGFYNNPVIDYLTTFFILMAGVNFSLYFIFWRNKNLKTFFSDSEFRTYFSVYLLFTLAAVIFLWKANTYTTLEETVRYALLHMASFMTSSGFISADLSTWPVVVPILMIFSSVIGACAGSTGGGMKVIRVLLLMKQGAREINQLAHPKAQLLIKVNHRPVPEAVIKAVWGFAAMYVALYAIFMIGMMAAGYDQITAFSAVAACLNNMGAGIGGIISNFAGLSDFAKWWLSLAMIMGRLELFTVLALFSPMFWR